MGIAVLGPVQLTGADGTVRIRDRKAREALTVLALAAPRPVSVRALVEMLWDEPPPSAVKTVQAHLSRVRGALATALGRPVLTGGPAGYRLDAAEELDVLAVGALRRRARLARLAGDDHGAAELLARARDCWRGEPELPATTGGEAERARLAEEHLGLAEEHLAALVAARPGDALAELEALCVRHPARERIWELRIAALHRCGRQADALAAFRTVRRHLAAELGVDPGPGLRAAEAAVLAQTLPSRPASSGPAPAVVADVPRYADADGVHVAYGVFGDGPVDVLLLDPTFVPVDAFLEEPHLAGALARLAGGRRVIAPDRRGLGLSDPVAAPPTPEDWAADALAVLDAAGAPRAHVLANDSTAPVALLLAARHPGRVATITLVNGYARTTRAPDYPHGLPTGELDETLRDIHTPGARPATDVLGWIAPSVAEDTRFRSWWDAVGRRGASPGTAALVHRAFLATDVRDVLAAVQAPVLLVSRTGCASNDPGHSRYLAAHLPDAVLDEYDDPDGPWFLGDVDRLTERFAAFAARGGVRPDLG
ncbi:alpha/beta fold hydrolase [Pseudonocardia sp.]|uniref:alpha/beta fold hydrolase n=1 Tax=Pseudonocardia sp. TaxID=60912 RepID=UPI003D0D2279